MDQAMSAKKTIHISVPGWFRKAHQPAVLEGSSCVPLQAARAETPHSPRAARAANGPRPSYYFFLPIFLFCFCFAFQNLNKKF
jgi:hypothetical protein